MGYDQEWGFRVLKLGKAIKLGKFNKIHTVIFTILFIISIYVPSPEDIFVVVILLLMHNPCYYFIINYSMNVLYFYKKGILGIIIHHFKKEIIPFLYI